VVQNQYYVSVKNFKRSSLVQSSLSLSLPPSFGIEVRADMEGVSREV